MNEDRERWDARHAAAIASPAGVPDEFVLESLAFLGNPAEEAARGGADLVFDPGLHILAPSRILAGCMNSCDSV